MTTTYRINHGLVERVVDGVPTGEFVDAPIDLDPPNATPLPLTPTEYTETYATDAQTIPAATYAAPAVTYAAPAVTAAATVTNTATATATVTKTNSSPYGFSTGDADIVVAQLAAHAVDIAAHKVQMDKIAVDALATNAKLAAAATDAAADKVALVALAADVLALKKLIVSLVNDLEDVGVVAIA